MTVSSTNRAKILFILSNLLPILGIVFLNWDLTSLLFLYWAESAVIGFYHVIRIIRSSAPSELKAFLAPFFSLHFGGFMVGHAIFLFVITFILSERGLLDPSLESANLMLTNVVMDPLSAPALIFAMVWPFLIAYMISHGFETFQEQPALEPSKDEVMQLLFSPYKRIVVMHLTIIFGIGAFVGLSVLPVVGHLAGTAIIPLVFIGIKTIVEFRQTFSPKRKTRH
jgi:hypothetical protein